MLSDSAILKKIEQQPKRSAGFKQLVRELGLRGNERRELDEHRDWMDAGGLLLKGDSDRYALLANSAGENIVISRLRMHRHVYGFVLPDLASLGTRCKIFAGGNYITPPIIETAMPGDRVR